MSESARRAPRDVDWVLVGATVAIALVGVAFVHSATTTGSGMSALAWRQVGYLAVSLVAMAAMAHFDYRKLAAVAVFAYVAGILLLVAVLLFGTEIGGARAWLRLPGLSLQPSELMKVATVLLLATIVARRSPGPLRLPDVLTQAAVVALPVGLILLQPDAGTALTFGPLLAAAVFVSGIRWRWILAGCVLLAVLAPVGWSVLEPYQQDRLRIVVNPDMDPSGRGYQTIQSRVAVGSGGLTGQGFAAGPQNRLGFLPERHTDFIFAIIAEEWGFLGAVAVLGLYVLVIRRLADAAVLARERLGAFLCIGAMMLLSVHVIVNVAMVLGLLPTIGIPLPLLSYGGSSLMASCCLIGLAANVRMHRFAR